MFLSVDIGSITTDIVCYSILAADFLINLVCCFIILWCDRNWSERSREWQVKAVLNLIINESVEFLTPIAYVICLLMAYYGPNAEIMGNIKNSYWQYSAIEDIGDTVSWIGIMFSVDLISVIVSFILLQCYCKINILVMYLQLQEHMGYIMAISTGYMLSLIHI